jgi:hypothetical protein
VNDFDEFLLRKLPVLRRYCWIAVVEFRKQGGARTGDSDRLSTNCSSQARLRDTARW